MISEAGGERNSASEPRALASGGTDRSLTVAARKGKKIGGEKKMKKILTSLLRRRIGLLH
jgi:hypothetical protein